MVTQLLLDKKLKGSGQNLHFKRAAFDKFAVGRDGNCFFCGELEVGCLDVVYKRIICMLAFAKFREELEELASRRSLNLKQIQFAIVFGSFRSDFRSLSGMNCITECGECEIIFEISVAPLHCRMVFSISDKLENGSNIVAATSQHAQ